MYTLFSLVLVHVMTTFKEDKWWKVMMVDSTRNIMWSLHTSVLWFNTHSFEHVLGVQKVLHDF